MEYKNKMADILLLSTFLLMKKICLILSKYFKNLQNNLNFLTKLLGTKLFYSRAIFLLFKTANML